MPHDVFISYSSKDKIVAEATCAWLESRGVDCWIAPRNILPSKTWGESIIKAIKETKLMILIFSSSANTSPQIKREVERAVHFGVAILPMRIEDVFPEGDLDYFLGMPQWFNAITSPLESHLEPLARVVQELIVPDASGQAKVAALVQPSPPGPAPVLPALSGEAPARPPAAPESSREVSRQATGKKPASFPIFSILVGAFGGLFLFLFCLGIIAYFLFWASPAHPAEQTSNASPTTPNSGGIDLTPGVTARGPIDLTPGVTAGHPIDLTPGLPATSPATAPGSEAEHQGLNALKEKNYAQASALLLQAANQGDSQAMLYLASQYERGQGVPKDYFQARAWLQKSADLRNALAWIRLGFLNREGKGGPVNFVQARNCFQKAADLNDSYGYYLLGECSELGQGCPQDNKQALAYYQQAADRGHSSGLYRVGWFYEHGIGVAQDSNRAIYNYRRALTVSPNYQGARDALTRLGQNP